MIVTLISLSLLFVPGASAQATIIPCEGAFIPLGVLDYGVVTEPGENMHIRGMIAQYQQDMPGSDPRCSGINTVVTNANWDAYGVGPAWGTFHVDLTDESTAGWDGTWTGMSYADGTTSIRVKGRGYGDLEGLKVFVDIQFPGMFMPGVASGYILDPLSE